MKQSVQAALVQFSPWPMREMDRNVDYIKSQIDNLAQTGNELIVFPEMSVTNFFEHDANGREAYWNHGAIAIEGPQLNSIIMKAREHQCYVVVGFAERSPVIGMMHNSAALIGPDGLIGVARKIHFPGLEKLYYTSGTSIDVFETPIGRIGICICYDCMFPEVTRALAVKGAEIIVSVSSIWEGGAKGGIGLPEYKKAFWDQLPLVRAMENQAFVIACNGGGSHMIGRDIGTWSRLGMSKIVAPNGEMLAKADHADEAVLTAVLKERELIQSRSQYTFLADRKPYLFQDLNTIS
ncbi:carbon-nitrogen hydrolase family protein [Ferviditalea candida]|uniref:Carbon-nitrogen hydrolase family protein n=1 Tax=Ferviditalea candida TaxID=3108399 RepID=A0ABU5ZGZ8_9BACL|nr:carbon-nitrogen hydrolase family protein [Paenibacillaceae bacterium T2]